MLVLLNSLEMSGEEVVGRIIAGQYEMMSENIEMGTLTPEEWEKMNHGLQVAKDWPFSVDDTPGISIEAIAARAETEKLRNGLDLLIIDYVQLVKCQTGWGDKLRNRQQEVGHVSRTMKEIARRLNIPVVAAAQVNRMSENRTDFRIRLADLREAGDLEQDADCVILIQPPGDEQPKDRPIIEFEVAKHRGGRTGSTNLLFAPSLPSFRNVAAGSETRDWWR
jgi:replicative DNA helicase